MLSLVRDNRDVIEKDWYVEKPIFRLKRKIVNSMAKKIILSGESGVGKSITLYKLQYLFDKSKKPILYTSLKRSLEIPQGYDEESYLRYYFDITFSQYLKKYLRRDYAKQLENSKLLKDGGVVDQRTRTLFEFQTDYNPKPLMIRQSILPLVVREAKRLTGINSIGIAVDDFDRNPDTELSQKVLIDLLKCFDKTIISVNSNSLSESCQKARLRMHGYKIVTPKYSTDPRVVRDIIDRRVSLADSDSRSLIEELNYPNLVSEHQGNISEMISSIESLCSLSSFNEGAPKKALRRKESNLFLGRKKDTKGTNI